MLLLFGQVAIKGVKLAEGLIFTLDFCFKLVLRFIESGTLLRKGGTELWLDDFLIRLIQTSVFLYLSSKALVFLATGFKVT